MKKFLFYLIQFTWGLPQNILGLLIMLINIKCRKEMFRNSLLTYWNVRGGMSLGMFIFLNDDSEDKRMEFYKLHEYGHSIQSLILGPLYLFIIGIPSFLWANNRFLVKRRRNTGKSYYSFYTERWANRIFEHYIKE